ncbi:hypothetical protein Indivirus_3_50 [Indivirus ILV1]|uniref:Uncharacterized protein n=1 Tax=Indivirus ILV1 TaxID=1977633 RepID=A0A1V0SDP0_9VIRU|nr:hypothetical protein Indivirus_3_50 [Indivirus ILV1]
MKSKRNPKQKSKTTNSDTLLEIITGKKKVNVNRKPKSKYYQQKIQPKTQKKSSMRKTRRKDMNLSNQMS